MKLGVIEDTANRQRLAKLLRVRTSQSGEGLVSLDEYVGRMKARPRRWPRAVFLGGGRALFRERGGGASARSARVPARAPKIRARPTSLSDLPTPSLPS